MTGNSPERVPLLRILPVPGLPLTVWSEVMGAVDRALVRCGYVDAVLDEQYTVLVRPGPDRRPPVPRDFGLDRSRDSGRPAETAARRAEPDPAPGLRASAPGLARHRTVPRPGGPEVSRSPDS